LMFFRPFGCTQRGRMILKLTSIMAGIAACVWIGFAADRADSKFRVTVQMVQLRATVTDVAGRYVRDLNEQQFRVLQNGIEQKIKVLSTHKQPEADRNQ